MSVQHTPGPWVAREQRQSARYGGRVLGWIVETERGDRIGWIDFGDIVTNQGDSGDYVQSGVNARLIAAAPDLLTALGAVVIEAQYLIDWLEAYFEPPPVLVETLKSARAAIAKATGEAS